MCCSGPWFSHCRPLPNGSSQTVVHTKPVRPRIRIELPGKSRVELVGLPLLPRGLAGVRHRGLEALREALPEKQLPVVIHALGGEAIGLLESAPGVRIRPQQLLHLQRLGSKPTDGADVVVERRVRRCRLARDALKGWEPAAVMAVSVVELRASAKFQYCAGR